ncbi:diguanylate cyclase [Pseudodesulfovibrio sp.]|uniref:diguanylate cyclase n=1 Tax=Pseudodesulfovibrio sp. TaxID=2035812 RepID=UPI0026305E68|nr:diguanylate cyclase [Pseudodesulfovibrio sp.]MDD3310763.1 diguanylate cyclase [Pseudodesulfovibrio sp.]
MSRKILLVDDDRNLLDALALTLRHFDVDTEPDSCRALERLKSGDYAVVVTDMRMPVMDGVALLRSAMFESPDTVRLMLTGHGDLEIAMKAINASGVYRFMVKPVEARELCRTVSEALEEYDRRLREAALREYAMRDELTGLATRSLLIEHGRAALARARRSGTTFALLFIDLDGFKLVNDTYGHEAGDKVLTETARRIMARVREKDCVARFGGDEFVVMLADLERWQDALTVGEVLVGLVEGPIEWDGALLEVRASLGVGLYPAHGETFETVMRVADEAMYRAKRNGGGRVELAGNGRIPGGSGVMSGA